MAWVTRVILVLAIVLVAMCLVMIVCQAEEWRLGPSASLNLFEKGGSWSSSSEVGGRVEVGSFLDEDRRHWAGLVGDYTGEGTSTVRMQWDRGLGAMRGGLYPARIGLNLVWTTLDPSRLEIDALTALLGLGLSFSVPLPGADGFAISSSVSYQVDVSGDSEVSALVPIAMAFPGAL